MEIIRISGYTYEHDVPYNLYIFYYLNFWCGLIWEDAILENELVNIKLNLKL